MIARHERHKNVKKYRWFNYGNGNENGNHECMGNKKKWNLLIPFEHKYINSFSSNWHGNPMGFHQIRTGFPFNSTAIILFPIPLILCDFIILSPMKMFLLLYDSMLIPNSSHSILMTLPFQCSSSPFILHKMFIVLRRI